MHCPICRSKETRVVDSRLSQDGYSTRRRRECVKCTYRFSTVEEMGVPDIMVVKQDGRRDAYSRKKIEHGLRQALTKRQYTQEKFEKLVHNIERDIRKKRKREVTSQTIGEIVMKHLQKFDKVAYIRFASIYRAFEDVKKFQSAVRSLQKKSK